MTISWSKGKATEFLKPEEVQSILSSIVFEGDKLLLLTLWETGGRPGEVSRLTPEHIDLKNNCILLRNFKQNKRKNPADPKKPHPLKRVYLFPESTLCQDLLDYCHKNHINAGEWVFPSRMNQGKPFNEVTLWRLVTGICANLGIRYIKKDTRTGEYMNKPAWPHTVRHGAAMHILRRTGRLDIVQAQLGHSSVATTQIYARLTDEDRRKIVQESPIPEKGAI